VKLGRLLGLIASLLLLGVGACAASPVERVSAPRPAYVLNHERDYEAAKVRLEPPPADKQPAVRIGDLPSLCAADPSCFRPGPNAVNRLALFSDDGYGQTDSSGRFVLAAGPDSAALSSGTPDAPTDS
jgi:hypothetical protein